MGKSLLKAYHLKWYFHSVTENINLKKISETVIIVNIQEHLFAPLNIQEHLFFICIWCGWW